MKLKCILIGHDWVWGTLPRYWKENLYEEPKEIINYGKHRAVCKRCLKKKMVIEVTEEEEEEERIKLYNRLVRKSYEQK